MKRGISTFTKMYAKKVSRESISIELFRQPQSYTHSNHSTACNLASIQVTPEIAADITQFYETVASSLLDHASTLEIGEEISLIFSRCPSFARVL